MRHGQRSPSISAGTPSAAALQSFSSHASDYQRSKHCRGPGDRPRPNLTLQLCESDRSPPETLSPRSPLRADPVQQGCIHSVYTTDSSAWFMAQSDEAQLTYVLSGELPGISPNARLPNQVGSTSDRDLPVENESGHRWCRTPAASGLVLLPGQHL
jgi:hypothetical protein